MWGMKQISAAHRQEIELSQCIKTVKNNKHDETEGRNKHKGQAQGPVPTTEKGQTHF